MNFFGFVFAFFCSRTVRIPHPQHLPAVRDPPLATTALQRLPGRPVQHLEKLKINKPCCPSLLACVLFLGPACSISRRYVRQMNSLFNLFNPHFKDI